MNQYLDIGVITYVGDETRMLVLNTKGKFEEPEDSLQELLMKAFAQMQPTNSSTGRVDGMLLQVSTDMTYPAVHAMWCSARGVNVRIGIVFNAFVFELAQDMKFNLVTDMSFLGQLQSAILQTQPVGNTYFDQRQIGIRALLDQELMPGVAMLWYSIEKET